MMLVFCVYQQGLFDQACIVQPKLEQSSHAKYIQNFVFGFRCSESAGAKLTTESKDNAPTIQFLKSHALTVLWCIYVVMDISSNNRTCTCDSCAAAPDDTCNHLWSCSVYDARLCCFCRSSSSHTKRPQSENLTICGNVPSDSTQNRI